MPKTELIAQPECSAVLAPSESSGLAQTTALANEGSTADAQWREVLRHLTFTFAGVFVGGVSFRCMMLVRHLGQPPYPLAPALFDQFPKGIRALHIASQPISSKLSRVFLLGRGICYVPLQCKRFFIDLDNSFDTYLGKFGRKTRETMRRKIRRFTQNSNDNLPWREFRHPEDAAEFHRLASEVSRKTYQHRMLRAGIDTSIAFREEMVRSASENHLRGYILFRQNVPIAYMLCQDRRGDLVIEKMGFDPAFASDSPGFVLFYLTLQQLFAAKEFRRLDFGEGEYPYKEQMATGSIEAAEIYCFPTNIRNLLFVAMHSAFAVASRLLRSMLARLGFLQALKNIRRGGIGALRER